MGSSRKHRRALAGKPQGWPSIAARGGACELRLVDEGKEEEVAVGDVLTWLSRTDEARARLVVIGCALDNGVDDEPLRIKDLDFEHRAVVLANGRRAALRGLPDAILLDARPGAPLAAAVESCWSPEERRSREVDKKLRTAKIDPARLRSPEDRERVLAFLNAVHAGDAPSASRTRAFYDALSFGNDPGLARVGARALDDMAGTISKTGGRPPDSLHWQRASLLRAANKLEEAVAASEILVTTGVRDEGARRILATTRAAALLDLFEARRAPDLLARAWESAGIAFAIDQNDEKVQAVYRRYHSLRAGHEWQ